MQTKEVGVLREILSAVTSDPHFRWNFWPCFLGWALLLAIVFPVGRFYHSWYWQLRIMATETQVMKVRLERQRAKFERQRTEFESIQTENRAYWKAQKAR